MTHGAPPMNEARSNLRRRLVLGLVLADLLAAPAVMGMALLLRYGFVPPLRHAEAYLDFLDRYLKSQ